MLYFLFCQNMTDWKVTKTHLFFLSYFFFLLCIIYDVDMFVCREKLVVRVGDRHGKAYTAAAAAAACERASAGGWVLQIGLHFCWVGRQAGRHCSIVAAQTVIVVVVLLIHVFHGGKMRVWMLFGASKQASQVW